MPSKSHSKRTADHQFDVAAGKRARTPETSDTESDASPPSRGSDDDSSDFEEKRTARRKKLKAPPAKRRKVQVDKALETSSRKAKAPVVISGQTLPSKLPPWAQGSEGTILFSVGWWKEIAAKDAFWKEFDKRVPKTIKAKRLSVNVALDLETEVVSSKIEEDGEVSKVVKGRPAKRSTGRRDLKNEKSGMKPSVKLEMPDTTDDECDLESVLNGKLRNRLIDSKNCVLPKKNDILSKIPKEKHAEQKENTLIAKKTAEKEFQSLASSDEEDDLILVEGPVKSQSIRPITKPEIHLIKPDRAEKNGVSATQQDASNDGLGEKVKKSTFVASVAATVDTTGASEKPDSEKASEDTVVQSTEAEGDGQGKMTETSTNESKGSWEPTNF